MHGPVMCAKACQMSMRHMHAPLLLSPAQHLLPSVPGMCQPSGSRTCLGCAHGHARTCNSKAPTACLPRSLAWCPSAAPWTLTLLPRWRALSCKGGAAFRALRALLSVRWGLRTGTLYNGRIVRHSERPWQHWARVERGITAMCASQLVRCAYLFGSPAAPPLIALGPSVAYWLFKLTTKVPIGTLPVAWLAHTYPAAHESLDGGA